MGKGNRERILVASIELFNQSGTIEITTNHIARHLRISPGNLYFHFANKEEIVRVLFQRQCEETYRAWDPKRGLDPRQFLEEAAEVFWKYRFFHREMYHLRRKDPLLSAAWKRHLRRCIRLLKLNYGQWLKHGWMKDARNAIELKHLTDAVLLSSNAFLGFFESPEKPASRKNMRVGIEYADLMLSNYYTEPYKTREVRA